MNKTIENAPTPEEFIAALRRQSQKLHEDAASLQEMWQDENAGKFWSLAANKLDRMAASLERAWERL